VINAMGGLAWYAAGSFATLALAFLKNLARMNDSLGKKSGLTA
jgi:hypothetical protein